MRKLVKLKKELDVTFESSITEFLSPDYIYLPVKKNYQLLVKNGDILYKGSIVMENNLNKVISPVSGVVFGACEKMVGENMEPCLVIENDFKEKEKPIKKKAFKPDKDALISKLYDFHFKYIASLLESKKINNLIISGIEDEPYIMNNSFLLKHYAKEILQMTDTIVSLFNIPKTLIAMKSSDTKNAEEYLSKVGTYPQINLALVDDKYLLGNPFFLREHLGFNEIDTFVIEAKEMLDMYNAIFYSKMPVETFVTISGPCVQKSKVIKVKVGSLYKDVIDKEIKLCSDDVYFIQNGLMKGNICNIDNTVITSSSKGIIVISKQLPEEKKCDNCGLCYKYCPVKVNPKKVMDTGKLSSNCIDCGLCSYICPSFINLRKYLRGDKNE